MRRPKSSPPVFENFSQLWESLGRIPPERIRLQPPPGTATEEDLLRAEARCNRLCELIDGTLVEKGMGFFESRLALLLAKFLEDYLEQQDRGILFGPDALLRVDVGQVRLPDVSFFSWDHFPNRELPSGQILDAVPDLSVEVLSPGNTKAEMARKRREYFLGGCKLVWEVDPVRKTVRVYTAPDESKLVREKGALDGGAVLPGFALPVAQLFERAGKRRA